METLAIIIITIGSLLVALAGIGEKIAKLREREKLTMPSDKLQVVRRRCMNVGQILHLCRNHLLSAKK